MPIGAMTMILANVGLQIYNNWCGSRQNKQLQQKREEYERAAREHNTQRMWQLMREGQEMTRQLEEERHKQRLEELKNDVGNLLQKLAYSATINNWPLSVLPIVMKNQALGNLLANQEEHIAMHCILTPSNYHEFNKVVFPRIEEKLDEYCNQYWSVLTDHPVLFYSGAWRSGQAPTEVQIDSMRSALGNLPTLLITPFFRPSDGRLIFQLRIWGVGTLNDGFNDFSELEPTEFQRTYTDKDDYTNGDGLLDEIIEDIIPYLQCVIGYIADTYFWSSEGLSPCLPKLLTNGTINTDGMKYLIYENKNNYNNLLDGCGDENPTLFFIPESLCELLDGISLFLDKKELNTKGKKILLQILNYRHNIKYDKIEDVIDAKEITLYDISLIDLMMIYICEPKLLSLLKEEIYFVENNIPERIKRNIKLIQNRCIKYNIENFHMDLILNEFVEYCHLTNLRNVSLLITQENFHRFIFHTYDQDSDEILYYRIPFNKCISVNKVENYKNINSIFENGSISQLSCKLERIDILKSRIMSNKLIY